MDKRKRGMRSLPVAIGGYTTKRELAERKERKSFPQCPPQPIKYRKSEVFVGTAPKAVYFTKHVSLSKIYDPEKASPYVDQMFARTVKIGEGSFGEVYKVISKEDGKIYAIKQLKLQRNRKYGFAEVRNYEKIGDHSNCVKHFMAWEESGIIYIQMEYCELSLAQYANLMPNLNEEQLREILYDMLQALDFLHKKNLIHLDVKPGNIMMSTGFYKLADFGLLVDLNENDSKRISTISDGDAKYLALEVLNKVYSYACDIFSLGISIVELATNIELPEFGPLWTQIRSGTLPYCFYNVSSELAKIIGEMMVVHPKRPPAHKILEYPLLKEVLRKDKLQPRTNYCIMGGETINDVIFNNNDSSNNNNNIVETPKRPLHEVPNNWSYGHGNKDGTPEYYKQTPGGSPLSIRRKGLSRTRLIF